MALIGHIYSETETKKRDTERGKSVRTFTSIVDKERVASTRAHFTEQMSALLQLTTEVRKTDGLADVAAALVACHELSEASKSA